MLCGPGQSSKIMYNGLAQRFDVELVISEDKPSSWRLLKRRIKNLGILKVLGQLCFMAFNRLVLQRSQKRRIAELMELYHLDASAPPETVTQHVDSINAESVMATLKRRDPDAVVVNGTRIISGKVLSCIDKPFINTHVGITPRYRGVHGGYWALANRDPLNCGVTVHLVNTGIDTGGVLYQRTISPEKKDGFNTYPIHQIAAAIPLMRSALLDVSNLELKVTPGVAPSQLWYHPTLVEYLKARILFGVK
jgi:Methionyl-tRNA formyltransferase